jgi:hypothetical protein
MSRGVFNLNSSFHCWSFVDAANKWRDVRFWPITDIGPFKGLPRATQYHSPDIGQQPKRKSPLNFDNLLITRGLSAFRSASRKSSMVSPCSVISSSITSRTSSGKNAPSTRNWRDISSSFSNFSQKAVAPPSSQARLTRFTAAQSASVRPELSTTFSFCPMAVPPLTVVANLIPIKEALHTSVIDSVPSGGSAPPKRKGCHRRDRPDSPLAPARVVRGRRTLWLH